MSGPAGSAAPAGRPARPAPAPAPELVASGYAIEIGDADILHDGLTLADLAHVLDLRQHDVIPAAPAARLIRELLAVSDIPAAEFPYDPALGEPYNSRERYLHDRLGDDAGYLNAGRTRREAVRIAFRLHLRRQLCDIASAAADLAQALAEKAARHTHTLMPDYTYLQQAQPSTFGHYLTSFAFPVLRDGERLLTAFDWVNGSPAGVGAVNGSRLVVDRAYVTDLLGFGHVIEHTRDAMWQVDGLIDTLSAATSLVLGESTLAQDLEIFSAGEFGFLQLAAPFARSSIAMPQKRNPYALAIARGSAGVMIGRLTGLLAVLKSPSARSDTYIFSYGEVPRGVDLALRITRLMAALVATLEVDPDAMSADLALGYGQATDLAEFAAQRLPVDYRTAHTVIGATVRTAARRHIPGHAITAALIDECAREITGAPWGLTDAELAPLLDPARIVASRTSTGGAAADVVGGMVESCRDAAAGLSDRAASSRRRCDDAERALIAQARRVVRRA